VRISVEGEVLTMIPGQWVNRRTGTLLLLASIVGVVAILFGNAYVPHGHVAEDEHAEEQRAEADEEHAGAAEEEEHAEEAEEGAGSRSLKIGGSILISTAGAGLVPLGLLLVSRRPRDEDELAPVREPARPAAGPPEPAAGNGLEPVLRPALALLSAGAAVVHFAVIPGHWDDYWGQGLFFSVAAVAQLLWALWVVVAPSRLIYLAGAAGNAAIVAMWIVTRTAGVPAGPGAGEREAVEFADTLATAFEVVLVAGALVLARRVAARPVRGATSALAASVLLALVVAALTAASLLSLVEL
jgi:hypothetical protein